MYLLVRARVETYLGDTITPSDRVSTNTCRDRSKVIPPNSSIEDVMVMMSHQVPREMMARNVLLRGYHYTI